MKTKFKFAVVSYITYANGTKSNEVFRYVTEAEARKMYEAEKTYYSVQYLITEQEGKTFTATNNRGYTAKVCIEEIVKDNQY